MQQLIAIDWGSSNFRAWRLALETGEVLDGIRHGLGATSLAPDDFAAYCRERIAPWRNDAPHPLYLAGMVGAAGGWQLAPQLPLPLRFEELAAEVMAIEGFEQAWLVPGAKVTGARPDVMRGEEMQIFGAVAKLDLDDACLCLPGTHSKWARVREGALVDFSTAMTGELYALLRQHSILAAHMQTSSDDEADFARGLAESQSELGVLNQLFSARSRVLCGDLAPGQVSAYVSGILIGQEVAAMGRRYVADAQTPLILVCAEALRRPYEQALSDAGLSHRWMDAAEASLAGLLALYRQHRGQLRG